MRAQPNNAGSFLSPMRLALSIIGGLLVVSGGLRFYKTRDALRKAVEG